MQNVKPSVVLKFTFSQTLAMTGLLPLVLLYASYLSYININGTLLDANAVCTSLLGLLQNLGLTIYDLKFVYMIKVDLPYRESIKKKPPSWESGLFYLILFVMGRFLIPYKKPLPC